MLGVWTDIEIYLLYIYWIEERLLPWKSHFQFGISIGEVWFHWLINVIPISKQHLMLNQLMVSEKMLYLLYRINDGRQLGSLHLITTVKHTICTQDKKYEI